MSDGTFRKDMDDENAETREWLDALDDMLRVHGPGRVRHLMHDLQMHAHLRNIRLPFTANTPYVNTIPRAEQPPYPGDREIERRIKSIIRWNAMAMVVRANRAEHGIGGHISSFASAATLYEVGFNHFFSGRTDAHEGDPVFFQGHASPGIYARAFLEGRLSAEHLDHFRRDVVSSKSATSYPHPWIMPTFWQFPTVSMGLGPIMAIYLARFSRYLEDRGLKAPGGAKIWAFLGDGETDEPEALGAITLAAREKLDNLIFVVNCNLQRLDGPVRGNGKIIQELESAFRGSGWNVIKVIWGDDWDELIEKDQTGELVHRMNEVVDGQMQKYTVSSGAYIREHFFNTPHLRQMVEHLSDDKLKRMRAGGHDPVKVFAAYKAAVEHIGSPTVILARTIKGYGLGEAGEGRNITHQQKKLNEEELREFRSRFGIPISDADVAGAPFYRPPENSPELAYVRERRQTLGGYVPSRRADATPIVAPAPALFEEFHKGTDGREVSTTMVFVKILAKLLRDGDLGRRVVPIVPDEARTFGMESLFRQHGIYSHPGQLYEPVDSDSLLYYKEATDGQILEEGITEAGAMSSFIAAGTSHSTWGVPTIPFFIFYSMFGLQRVGDLVWAAADSRCRGFLLGATAGRTTLAGEGLQHQDGQSHVLAMPVPNLVAYDPAFAYELAVIIEEGIRRMYVAGEDIFHYITLYNESYAQPVMPNDTPGGVPGGVREGILRGMYRVCPSALDTTAAGVSGTPPKAVLLGSGAILNEVLSAQTILEEKYGVAAEVWSVTSYKQLRRDGMETERWNRLHPGETPRVPYVSQCLTNAGAVHVAAPDVSERHPGRSWSGTADVHVAASDYLKILPDSIAPWTPSPLVSLGTDGFGRSDSRGMLRKFFEIDARHVAFAALSGMHRRKMLTRDVVQRAARDLEIDPEKTDPLMG